MIMKLSLKSFILVNIILCLVGVVSILIGIIATGLLAKSLLDAVGIGLLAAGAVNIVDRSLTLEPPPIPLQGIEVAAEKRIALPQEIIDLKYAADKVDIIGVSLTHVLDEIINDPRQRIIDRLLKHNLQLRLFMVHPASEYLKQRAREDNNQDIVELVRNQKYSVELCVKFFDQLSEAYKSASKAKTLNRHLTGSLQIKLLDFCPYISIYRIDEEDIYWGLYTSDKAGVNLPLFRTSANQNPTLYKHLHQHIHGLMDRDVKYPDLVSMTEMGRPILNSDLAVKTLGSTQLPLHHKKRA
jgi:hypothetical protein